MFLAIDIGNSSITLGVYRADSPGPRWRLSTDTGRMKDEYGIALLNLFQHSGVDPKEIEAVGLASVVPALTDTIAGSCTEYLGVAPMIVGVGIRTGVRILYDDPHQVGADRVADAAAAHKLYGGPACIVDFGTATTFDAVSAEGDYLGGAIAPGISIAADALFRQAAKLPKVEVQHPGVLIGRNNVQSVQSGVVFGYVGLVEGMVQRFRAELGREMKVIGTGSLVEFFAQETEVIEISAPWLTLDGIKIIYDLNR
jgi:type III pantothenate kinase